MTNKKEQELRKLYEKDMKVWGGRSDRPTYYQWKVTNKHIKPPTKEYGGVSIAEHKRISNRTYKEAMD